MNEIILYAAIAFAVVLLATVVWLTKRLQKLQRSYRLLENKVDRNTKDIAGLCSAAVSVDHRVQGNDQRLEMIGAKVAEYQGHQHANVGDSYQLAIEKIRCGADAEDLVRECGLTGEEAVLLIRLHGR